MELTLEAVQGELTKLAATFTTKIKELKEAQVPQSEINERIDKMAADFAEMQQMAADIRTRAVQTSPSYYEGAKVANTLVQLGVFGVKDLNGINRFSGEFGDYSVRFDADVQAALRLADDVYMIDRILSLHTETARTWARQKEASNDGGRSAFIARFPKIGTRYDALVRDIKQLASKALGDGLNTIQAGSGADWIPTGFASNTLEDVRAQLPEVGFFPHINMPTNPWTWPLTGTRAKAYIRSEMTNPPRVNPSTANRTWTAKTYAAWSSFSDEVTDDSIIAVLPFMRSEHTRAMGEGLSNTIMNGDTSSVHQDANFDTTGSNDPVRAFDGLRKYALSNAGMVVAGGGVALSATLVRSAMEAMKLYAMNPAELGLFVGTKQYVQLLGDTNVLTMEKYGPLATIRTGSLGSIHGIAIYPTYSLELLRNQLSTTGVGTVTADNKNGAVLVNRGFWYLGDRRDTRVETDREITSGRNDIVTTARWAWNKSFATAASNHHVAYIVNLL